MAYLGNIPSSGTEESFKLLDDIKTYTLTFDGSSASAVSTGNDSIIKNKHRFLTGQKVTYTNGGGTDIGGLANNTSYYVIKSDENNIKLATTASRAASATAINITAVGGGTAHTLNVAFDGYNTKFKASFDSGTECKLTKAAQLTISMNGVVQQPQGTTSPSSGFGSKRPKFACFHPCVIGLNIGSFLFLNVAPAPSPLGSSSPTPSLLVFLPYIAAIAIAEGNLASIP